MGEVIAEEEDMALLRTSLLGMAAETAASTAVAAARRRLCCSCCCCCCCCSSESRWATDSTNWLWPCWTTRLDCVGSRGGDVTWGLCLSGGERDGDVCRGTEVPRGAVLSGWDMGLRACGEDMKFEGYSTLQENID